MKSRKKYILFVLISTLWIHFNCDVKNPAVEKDYIPLIKKIVAPASVRQGMDQKYMLYVTVQDPQGLENVDTVQYALANTSAGRKIQLFDRGQNGDLIPKDGVFSGPLDVFIFPGIGSYQLLITVTDTQGNMAISLSEEIFIEGALLYNPSVPDTLSTESLSEFHISIETTEPGMIDSVFYEIYLPYSLSPVLEGDLNDLGLMGDAAEGDGIYSLTIDLSDTLHSLGDHEIQFQATGSGGIRCMPVIAQFFIEGINSPPVLSQLEAPDTVNAIVGGAFLISIQVADPQGANDIFKVYFISTKPDGKPASGNPFELNDRGYQGDKIAKDGIYSIYLSITPENLTGDYTFRFYAEDRAGAVSEPITHVLTVIHEE